MYGASRMKILRFAPSYLSSFSLSMPHARRHDFGSREANNAVEIEPLCDRRPVVSSLSRMQTFSRNGA